MWRASLALLLLSCSASAQQQLNDPTAPPQYQAPEQTAVEQQNLRLVAIRTDGTGRIATINGANYRLGDRIEPYEITDITMATVTLKHRQKNNELTLAIFNQSSFIEHTNESSGGSKE